jgi:hypothetical protein
MGIEEQRKAEQFYLESDVNGIHTPYTNMVQINYLDMVKLMHGYAQEQVKKLTIPVVSVTPAVLRSMAEELHQKLFYREVKGVKAIKALTDKSALERVAKLLEERI